MSTGTSFPELPAERARLAFARTARDRMIERLERVDPDATADEFTKEYVEVTVAEALESLRSPGAGDFFGRIDEPRRGGGVDQWYIGRRHIEDDDPRPGRRRLAGADLGAVLPGDGRRPARDVVPAAVHARRG